jgi:hypothetical protein
MTKAPQRAGFATSVLVVVFFVTAVGFRISGGNVPSWFPITMGAILCVTTISAVICLVTTVSAFFRTRQSNAPSSAIVSKESDFNV